LGSVVDELLDFFHGASMLCYRLLLKVGFGLTK
jgi:hypothetical protein